MVKLVHLAPEKLARRIERSGLRGKARLIWTDPDFEHVRAAVHCTAQVADFTMTHQWMRELRRWNGRLRMVSVIATIPDDQPVWVGRYSKPKIEVSAADSIRIFQADPWGNEIIVPVHIDPSRVNVRTVRQDVGWQGTPERHWACVCPSCLDPGHPRFMRRLNAVYREALASGDLLFAENALERARGRLPVERLLRRSSAQPAQVARLLHWFKWPEVEMPLQSFLASDDAEVRAAAAASVLRCLPLPEALAIVGTDDAHTVKVVCEHVEWNVDPTVALDLLTQLAAHEDDCIRDVATRSIAYVEERLSWE